MTTYTLTRAGAELGVSERTVAAMIGTRREIGRKIGKRWHVTPAGLATLRAERAAR